jgi:hypothetical protein
MGKLTAAMTPSMSTAARAFVAKVVTAIRCVPEDACSTKDRRALHEHRTSIGHFGEDVLELTGAALEHLHQRRIEMSR